MISSERKYLFFVTKPYSFSILEPIQKYILDNKLGKVRWFTASTASNIEPNGKRLISNEEVISFNPDAVVVPGKIVPNYWPGAKVQVFHGIDDEVNDFYDINGQFDLYCTSGPVITERFETLANKYKYFYVTETGWPKLDPLFDAVNNSNSNDELIRKVGFDMSKPILLYAPTFPPKYTSAYDLYDEIVKLAEKYQLLVKFHTLMDTEIQNKYCGINSESLKIIEDNNILPYLKISDILITDTSSVAYEYLPLRRPIITYKTLARADKGINIIDPKDLHGAIIRSLNDPNEFSENREYYLDEIHPYSDDQSSKRVVQAIEDFIGSNVINHLSSKPRNIIRNYKVRKLISSVQ